MKTSEQNRIQLFDVAKGISIILMTYTHFGHNNLYPNLLKANDVFMLFKMPMFIFISGFLLSDKSTFFQFTNKKLDGLIKPSIIALLLISIVQAIYFKSFEAIKYFFVTTAHGDFNFIDFPLWFIMSLCPSIIIAKLIIELFNKTPKWVFFLSFSAIYVGLWYLSQKKWNVFYSGTYFPFVSYLLLGYTTKRIIKGFNIKNFFANHIAFILCLVGFSVLAYYRLDWHIHLDIGRFRYGKNLFGTILSSILGLYVVLYLCNYIAKITFISKPLVACSKASFFIFAFHIFAFQWLSVLLPDTIYGQHWITDSIVFATNLMLCYGAFKTAQKLPGLNKLILPLADMPEIKLPDLKAYHTKRIIVKIKRLDFLKLAK